jgi:5-deoxy-D-glucuronate isomerase
MQSVIIKNDDGFDFGQTMISSIDSPKIGMNFTVLKLKKGQVFEETVIFETAFLLMTGKVEFFYEQKTYQAKRACIFSQSPIALHTCNDKKIKIMANTHAEIMVIQTKNDNEFETIVFDEKNILENDKRGLGLLGDSSYRLVRTLFDKRNRPQSNLVLGEIITFPGHWSSTPSHIHPHPEVYHYRFSEPCGFAFAENGEKIVRIRHNDTMLITDNNAHAHATAPGYCLYTLWFIRHLDNNPYIQPTFIKEHAWAQKAKANNRVWQDYNEV